MVHGKDTEIMVSVIMITYGHEQYIEEAMNGIFLQQSDFAVELVIANDCSPDNTDEVVRKVMLRAPENITVLYTRHGRNKGANTNFSWAAQHVKGKYIALCEGDDYWTDPLKLQKQVDFLQKNPEYAMTFHSASFLDQGNFNENVRFSKVETRDYSAVELFVNWIVPTASLVFQKSVLDNPLYTTISNEKDLIFGDNLLIMACFEIGKVRGMKDSMCVYRKHEGGVSFAVDRNLLEMLNKQNMLFGKYFPVLQNKVLGLIKQRYLTHLKISVKSLKIKDSIYFSWKYIFA